MFSMLIEAILQGGIFFLLCFIFIRSRHIVVEGMNWYTSCMYLFTSHPKWFGNSMNES